jgi:hypothetical protein
MVQNYITGRINAVTAKISSTAAGAKHQETWEI